MRKGHSEDLPEKLKAELRDLEARRDADIDTREMPEIEDWSGARRGVFHETGKRKVTLRLDADVVEWFQSHRGKSGYRIDINRALREHIARHRQARVRG